jgi:hypothetical protein
MGHTAGPAGRLYGAQRVSCMPRVPCRPPAGFRSPHVLPLTRAPISPTHLSVPFSVPTPISAQSFASGFLFGELLARCNLQPDFAHFLDKNTPDARINNFTRLQVIHSPAFTAPPLNCARHAVDPSLPPLGPP